MSGRGLETNTADLNKAIVAEEKQIKEEVLKQAQLERDQKQVQEKVRIAQEKKVIEEKRLQLDLAKNSTDADKSKLALEKAKAEEAKALSQLAKLDALEKEKIDLLAKLQQEKDSREKVVNQQRLEEEKVAALRKELEKEIRASIQKEANLSQAQTSSPNKLSPTIYANRKALVIGNDSYSKVTPLVNAREDARVMAESLASLGYNVSMKLDVTQKQFLAELRNFKNQVKAGDEVALFYAGHGVQIASTNYLLPVDIQGQSEEEVRDDAISLQRLLDDMDDKKVKFTLAVIDACRDNPFKGSTRSALGTRGLAPTTAATGQMIVFSAGTGQQALDKVGSNDKSKNGLFTRIFVKEMQKEGLTVDRVVRNVRSEVVSVAKSVGHNQVPAIYDQVVGEYYFKQ
ncbi:caspase family protein [Polynucleobacter campilacus]|nr:caspase family protein [Polynucleobacter campilacus]